MEDKLQNITTKFNNHAFHSCMFFLQVRHQKFFGCLRPVLGFSFHALNLDLNLMPIADTVPLES